MDQQPKIENIHIRISENEKSIITDYCWKKGIRLSDFIRETCLLYIQKECNNATKV